MSLKPKLWKLVTFSPVTATVNTWYQIVELDELYKMSTRIDQKDGRTAMNGDGEGSGATVALAEVLGYCLSYFLGFSLLQMSPSALREKKQSFGLSNMSFSSIKENP